MANEIKIVRLDDRTLKAMNDLVTEIRQFNRRITYIADLINNAKFELADFDGELIAVIDGEEYIA